MIQSGCFTVVNPKTGGNRTIRIRPLPKSFIMEPGYRFAEYLAEGRGRIKGDDEVKPRWYGFAFVGPDGMPRIWKSVDRTAKRDVIAALSWICRKGPGREDWLRNNFDTIYQDTDIALDPDNPNLVDAARGIAARAWAEEADSDGFDFHG